MGLEDLTFKEEVEARKYVLIRLMGISSRSEERLPLSGASAARVIVTYKGGETAEFILYGKLADRLEKLTRFVEENGFRLDTRDTDTVVFTLASLPF